MVNKVMNSINPWQRPTALLVFAVPCLSLVTRWGVGLASFLFVLAALLYFGQSRHVPGHAWPLVRPVLAAFLLHGVVALAYCVLRPDVMLGSVEKPPRMLPGAAAMALVIAARPDHSALWRGLAGGAIGRPA